MAKKKFEFKSNLKREATAKEKKLFVEDLIKQGKLKEIKTKGMRYNINIKDDGTAVINYLYVFYITDKYGNSIKGKNGRAKQFSVTAGSEREAQQKRRELEARELYEKEEQEEKKKAGVSFGEIAEEVLEDGRKSNKNELLRVSTLSLYKGIARTNLKNHDIWNKDITTIDKAYIEELYKDVASIAVGRNGRVSKSFIGNVRAFLNHVLGRAKHKELINTIPTTGALIPKECLEFEKEKNIKGDDGKYLSREEVNQFLEVAKEDRHYLVYRIALSTGMRKGEIFGLTWDNIEGNTIKVNKSVIRDGNNFILDDEVKTKTSKRSIPIDDTVKEELKFHHRKQKAEGVKNPHNLLFPNREGKPYNLQNFDNRSFNKIMTQLKEKYPEFSNITFHSLRHTFATFHISHYKNLHYTKEILGHNCISITSNTYGHILKEEQEKNNKGFMEMYKVAGEAR